jgi:hypothetical protein
MAVLGLTVVSGASRAEASNGTCEAVGSGFHCFYNEGLVANAQKVWFDSPGGENLRRWESNEAWDYYGAGSHIYKCATEKRSDGTYFTEPSCGNFQNQGVWFNASWRPGWIYVVQGSGGPRYLDGKAWQE